MHSFCTRCHGWQMCTMAFALELVAKQYSNDQWVCDEVPEDVIQNDKLYYKFISTVTVDFTKLPCYFNKHIADEVSLPFFHCCHIEKNNKICIFCGLIDKELTKLAEIALDLSAEFRQFGTDKNLLNSAEK